MRLPRLRVRTLMVAVAAAAVMLGGWQMRGRRRHRLGLAMLCGVAGSASLDKRWGIFELFPETATLQQRPLGHKASDSEARRRSRYWHGLRRKYERAARYPWLPVPPDPPPPE